MVRKAAFEPLVRMHQGASLGYATALLDDAEDAADVVQDAFVQAYRGLRRMRPNSAFGPWFRTRVRNACLDRLRSSRRRRRAPIEVSLVGPSRGQSAVGGGGVERDQLAQQLRSAMALLSDEHRRCTPGSSAPER